MKLSLSLQTAKFLSGLAWPILICVLIDLPTPGTGQSFRLFRGGQNYGLMQIRKSGWPNWAIVCSKQYAFARKEADVLCRGLRKPSGHSVLTPYANYLVGNETFPMFDAVAIDFKCNGTEGSFANCVDETAIQTPKNGTCHRGIAVQCIQTAPEYRITADDRRLEVKIDTTWTSVCADGLTVNDAVVACRTVGRPLSDVRPLRVINKNPRGWKLRDLRCSGSETTLEDCVSVVWGDTDCDTGRDVGVFCADASEYKFRLMNGSALSAGRVEVFHKNRWGTICSRGDFTGNSAARVICKSLGFEYSSARVVHINEFGVGDGIIWMDKVNCTGSESNLLNCDRYFDGNPISVPCSHFDDVAVSCEGYRLDNQGSSGHIQVSYQGRWIDIYNNTFDLKAATVACRALGLSRSGARFISVDLVSQTDEILGVNSCEGFEETFFACHHDWLKPDDLRAENISVGRIQLTCQHAAFPNVQFRHPGEDSAGLYEVHNGTTWGTICGNGLGEKEAQVACRNLGLGVSFAAVLPTSYTSKGNGSVMMDGISCKGTENSLDQCDHNPWEVITCDAEHRDDLNIYCGKIEDNFDVRLSGGDDKAGRVEVKIYGSWGTVCSDGFDNNAAEVICRQLNLPISEPRTISIFPGGEGRVWLHAVNCTGDEENIRDCKYGSLIGQTPCTHDDDIGVVCSGTVVDPGAGISGGQIAGIVIAVIVLFVILIVALCVGIRKWSAARRDLGNNLLKTNSHMPSRAANSGDRVDYNHDNGVVNVAFNESPSDSRARAQDDNRNSRISRPYGGNGTYGHEKARDYDDDDNLSPPAYHTLDLNDGPSQTKSPNYAVKSPTSAKYYAGHHESYGAPRSPRDNTAGYRTPGPDGRSPRTPQSQGQDEEFGFDTGYKNQNPYLSEEADNLHGSQPGDRVAGRHGAPPHSDKPTSHSRDYIPGRGYDNESMPYPGYRGPRNDYQYASRPQTSPTRLHSSSTRAPEPSPTRLHSSSTRAPEPSPAYGNIDVPEGTSV